MTCASSPISMILSQATVERRFCSGVPVGPIVVVLPCPYRPRPWITCVVVSPMFHLESQIPIIHPGEHLQHVLIKGFRDLMHHLEVLDVQDCRRHWIVWANPRYLIRVIHSVVVCKTPGYLKGVTDL